MHPYTYINGISIPISKIGVKRLHTCIIKILTKKIHNLFPDWINCTIRHIKAVHFNILQKVEKSKKTLSKMVKFLNRIIFYYYYFRKII